MRAKLLRSRLQDLIEQAAIRQPEMPEMFERLMRQGVEVRHGWTWTGKSKGISYGLADVAFAGNQLGHNDVPSEPEVDLQQRELAQAVARSAMRILQLVGKTNAQGQISHDHERGNYRLFFDPVAGDWVIESKPTGEVILAGRARQLDVAQSRLTELDLQRFQAAEQRIEQVKQAQQAREKQGRRDRGFEM
jgi:hypothetical protein